MPNNQAAKPVETVELPEKQFVKYVGNPHVDERVLTTDDWRKAGVDGEHPTISWSRSNGFKVPLEDLAFLSPEDFARLIDGDPGLKVV